MAVLRCCKIRHPIQGQTRKAALAFLILSTIGWTVFVVFLGLITLETTVKNANCVIPKSRLDGAFTPHWCFLVTGPILYTCAVVALCVNKEGYLQMIINFFIAIYFICGGAILYTDWIFHGGALKYSFEFGACCTSMVTVVLYILMVPHFKSPSASLHEQSALQLDCINSTPAGLNPHQTHHGNDKMSFVTTNEGCNSNVGLQDRHSLIINPSTEQRKMISHTSLVPKDSAKEINVENEDGYVQPSEVVNASDGADDEADYVINEPFYEGYQEDEHVDEVYEDMADVIYDN